MRRTTPTPSRHFGFTVTELLVCVAIIAVLALLVVPALQSIGDRNRTMKCTANVRQIALALFQYIADHQGMLPPGNEPAGRELFLANSPSWGGTGPTWNEYLIKFYLNNDPGPFVCPSAPRVFSSGRGAYPHYAYNERLAKLENPPVDDRNAITRYRMIHTIPSHPKKILLADATRWSGNIPVGGIYNMNDATKVHPRHNGSAMVAFLDGHIEAVRASSPPDVYPPGFERNRFTPED